MKSFSILDHLGILTPVEGKSTATTGEYYCPLCGDENFKVDLKTGAYNAFSCGCTDTDEGKRRLRDAIAPLMWQKPLRPENHQTFTYDDETGTSLVQVVRTDDGEGKRQFYQKHWNGHGWAKGIPEVVKSRIRLYRIYSTVNEAAKGQHLFLVEGEGKVDALLSLGIPATCAIGGAGKWQSYGYPNYLEDLKDYQVVLCPDRDKPGVEHCEAVEADLIAKGIEVAGWLYAFPESFLWQRLPKSGGADVADWIAEGATAEVIRGAIEPRRITDPPDAATTEAEGYNENHCAMRKRYYRIKQQIGDRLRYNQLTKGIELDGQALDLDDLQVRLAVKHNIEVPDSQFQKIVSSIARDTPYSPVVEYLDRVHQQHGHSTAILDTLASRYFGTEHPLHDTYIRKTLIAAVARAYQPGCKVDTACILQGRQGALKSSFFKVLASNEWFDDSLGNASDKDERMKMHRVWFVEWAELEAVFGRKDTATTKAFMSSSRDLIRLPYGRSVQEFDRPSIIVGTTNKNEFLTDPTGSRRFWVIPVGRKVDIATLQRERDAIWGAAVTAYRARERWWLNDEETVLNEAMNQEYATQDPWTEAVESYLDNLVEPEATLGQVLEHCIGIDLEKQDQKAKSRVTRILRQLGWEPGKRRKVMGRQMRYWQRPNDEKSFFQESTVTTVTLKADSLSDKALAGVTVRCQSGVGNEGLSPLGVTVSPRLSPTVTPTDTASTPSLARNSVEGVTVVTPKTAKLKNPESLAIGDLVGKAGKRGWRGEIVSFVSDTQVNVQWTGEKSPQRHSLAELKVIAHQSSLLH